jgi:hypothetical protein
MPRNSHHLFFQAQFRHHGNEHHWRSLRTHSRSVQFATLKRLKSPMVLDTGAIPPGWPGYRAPMRSSLRTLPAQAKLRLG